MTWSLASMPKKDSPVYGTRGGLAPSGNSSWPGSSSKSSM